MNQGRSCIHLIGKGTKAWGVAICLHLSAMVAVAVAQAPALVSMSPPKNAIEVPASTNVSVSFSLAMNPATINATSFLVSSEPNGFISGAISYNPLNKSATFNPSANFRNGERISVTVTTDVRSQSGLPLVRSYSWSFTVTTDGGDGSFMRDSIYPIGVSSYAVCAVDLDGDGDADLATANPTSNSVSTIFNVGDARFVIGSSFPAHMSPYGIVAADFNSDGYVDVAAANGFSNDVSILLNSGAGSLTAGGEFPVGDFPVSLCRADLDGDGDIDITTANTYSNNVSVLLNDGDGDFADRTDYQVGTEPYCVIAADLDNDADFDLIACNDVSGNVSVLLNSGNGTFAGHVDYAVCFGPIYICGSDFDGDGDVDLATANDGADSVSVLLNNGVGAFGAYSTYPVGEKPVYVGASDLDSDGDIDFAVSGFYDDGVSVLLNSGDGAFIPSQGCPAGDGSQGMALADFDGDGDVDAAVCNASAQSVAVLLNAVVCADSDLDGFGDPLHPENECTEDNCPYSYNPDQADSDGDGVGDSCDICPYHPLEDCCNPRGTNSPPMFTSAEIDTAIPGKVFSYVASASDPDCDGDELEIDIVSIPSWCVAFGDTIQGVPGCTTSDSVLRLTVNDGSQLDLMVVNLIVDKSNVGPIIEDTSSYRAFIAGKLLMYHPSVHDPDDSLLEISYPEIPDWCHVSGDSVIGISPVHFSKQNLSTIVADYCHSDTLVFEVYSFICGDANSSGFVDIDDVVFLVRFIFSGGEFPVPLESSDCNCRSGVDIDDLVYLINHVFLGGPEPCSECP